MKIINNIAEKPSEADAVFSPVLASEMSKNKKILHVDEEQQQKCSLAELSLKIPKNGPTVQE